MNLLNLLEESNNNIINLEFEIEKLYNERKNKIIQRDEIFKLFLNDIGIPGDINYFKKYYYVYKIEKYNEFRNHIFFYNYEYQTNYDYDFNEYYIKSKMTMNENTLKSCLLGEHGFYFTQCNSDKELYIIPEKVYDDYVLSQNVGETRIKKLNYIFNINKN